MAKTMSQSVRGTVSLLEDRVAIAARRGANPTLARHYDAMTAGKATSARLTVEEGLELLELAKLENNSAVFLALAADKRPTLSRAAAEFVDHASLTSPEPTQQVNKAEQKRTDKLVALDDTEFCAALEASSLGSFDLVRVWERSAQLGRENLALVATALMQHLGKAGFAERSPRDVTNAKLMFEIVLSYLAGRFDPVAPLQDPAVPTLVSSASRAAATELCPWLSSLVPYNFPHQFVADLLREDEHLVGVRELLYLARYGDKHLFERSFAPEAQILLDECSKVRINDVAMSVRRVLWSQGKVSEEDRDIMVSDPDTEMLLVALMTDLTEGIAMVDKWFATHQTRTAQMDTEWMEFVLTHSSDEALLERMLNRTAPACLLRTMTRCSANQRDVLFGVVSNKQQLLDRIVAAVDYRHIEEPTVEQLDMLLSIPGIVRTMLSSANRYWGGRGPLRERFAGVLAVSFSDSTERWRTAFELADTFHGSTEQFVRAVVHLKK